MSRNYYETGLNDDNDTVNDIVYPVILRRYISEEINTEKMWQIQDFMD